LFRERSISLKQGLLLIVLAALLPISVTSVIQSMVNWNGMQQTAMSALQANAKAVAERERDAFLIANRLLTVASANPDVRAMVPNCSQVLRTGFSGYEAIVNFIRTDADGIVRCSALPYKAGASLSGETWWQNTKSAGALTVSQPTMGSISGIPIIVVALPLKGGNGSFAGTFSAGLNISQLSKSVIAAPEAKTGAIAVISSNGTLVASSRPALPFVLPTKFEKNGTGMLRGTDGDKWEYRMVPLSGDALFVLYAEPRSKIMSAALAQLKASIILPLIALALTLFAIWFGTNYFVIRWLSALRKLSDDITKGNFSGNRQAFVKAPRELRELSDDLNDMAKVIDTRTTDLTDALEAKTELTREIHHRVKNNLQIVTSLLTMQASRMTDDVAQTALKQARARIVALALIHRLTYEQESEQGNATVTVESLMDELCKQLRYANRSSKHIQLSSVADHFAVDVDLAVPLALFIVEAVTNSYRHAFPDHAAGTIDLKFENHGSEVTLIVRDNGQGYDVDSHSKGDMGTELMCGFANQLNGSVSFSSERAAGSITTLRFPC
jgi:two-component sensor histidine kinase